MYVSHSESAFFTSPGKPIEYGGSGDITDITAKIFPKAYVTYACLSLLALTRYENILGEDLATLGLSNSNAESPCFNIQNWIFQDVKPTNSAMVSVADEKLSQFQNNRIFGQSIRGAWQFDIRPVFRKLAQVDYYSDKFFGTSHTTDCNEKPANGQCIEGYHNITDSSENKIFCCKDLCEGAMDDPETPEREDAGNSACYNYKHALHGMEVKFFWRSLQ